MLTSKREELFDGLIRLATVPFLVLASVGTTAGLVVVLFLIAATTAGGVARLLEALFGDGGLVCDIYRMSALEGAKCDRLKGRFGRIRMTNPSRRLRERDAVRRMCGLRRRGK